MREEYSFWASLGETERARIRSAMDVRQVARGETLIERGASADTLYVVDFGLFEVRNASGRSMAQIGADQLIGEIGFFADAPRNAKVVAARDSQVLQINREAFEALSRSVPEVQSEVIRALAKRLATITPMARERLPSAYASRVVAVVAAGSAGLSPAFIDELDRAVRGLPGATLLRGEDARAQFPGEAGRYAMAGWLAEAERDHSLVVCVADERLTAWSQTALRGADQVVLVAAGSPETMGEVEAQALEMFEPAHRRLVVTQAERNGFADPGARWRERRDVFMTHHVATKDGADVRSLVRFLAGRAVGFVAGAGGAFGPAHIGIFKAFQESAVEFDIFGGSSVGSAMAAGFAALMDPEEMGRATQEIFVRRKAMKRFNWPRYGLLDHSVLDEELRRHYLGRIEDVWKPYFAVATDLSTYSPRVLRKGLLWEAIRASAAIPGVLPPFVDADGHMLVDGGVVDNVPLAAMRSLKSGPNLIVDLRPAVHRKFSVAYDAIPGRRELLRRLAMPIFRSRPLPRFPGPTSVILRTLFANIGAEPVSSDSDLLLRPPPFPGSSFMNWDGHHRVFEAAYQWARQTIDKLGEMGNPALREMTTAGA
jgi:NTE family protein